MRIRAAVLERIGTRRPYATSTPIRVRSLDLADPGEHEVLVRIEVAGICHSDLSVVDGTRPRSLPLALGHEAAGIVEVVGSAVTDVAAGDRVVATFLPRCESCAECATDGRLPCSAGSASNGAGTLLGGGRRLSDGGAPVFHHLGVSGFATHAVIHRASLVKVDSDVPADVAALLGCAVLTGGGALLNASDATPGCPIIVIGLGGVGMAALLVARATGHPVIGVDTLPEKLEAARELGAESVVTPDEAITRGISASVVIECAGSAPAFETALAITAPGGTTVTVGLASPAAVAAVSPLILTAEARTVKGSYLGSSVPKRDIARYTELWRAGLLPVEKLVSGRTTLDDINAAMDALAEGRALRQLIVL